MNSRYNAESMSLTESKTSGSIILATVAYALSRGWHLDQICDVTGLVPEALTAPNARQTEATLGKLLHALDAKEPSGTMPISLAHAAPLTVFGGIAEGVQFSETLSDALQLLVNNLIVMTDGAKLTFWVENDHAVLSGSHPLDFLDKGLVATFYIALLYRLISDVLGVKNSLHEVHLIKRAVQNLEAYQQYFDAPVRFGSDKNQLIMKRKALQTTIDHSNARLFSYVKEHFKQISKHLKKQEWPDSLKSLRQSIIKNAERNDYRVKSAAAGANMSLRAAHRRASSEGYTLQRMIDQVRMESAMILLQDTTVRITSIAFTLGYSDDRSFRRAFKRIVGQTPTQFRSTHIRT